MSDVESRLKSCFSVIFPKFDRSDIATATMESVTDWDSIQTVTLASVIEEEFDLQLAPDQLVQIVSYDRVLSLLKDIGVTD